MAGECGVGELDQLAGSVYEFHIGDILPLAIGGNVFDLRSLIEVMPVDSDASLPGVAADLHEENRVGARVFLVIGEVRSHDHFVARESLRPMALLARLARGTQLFHGRRDRRVVGVERDGDHLAHAGELGPSEPSRARTDMAFDAGHSLVRRIAVGREFGLHDGVTGLPAELGGIHVLDAVVGGGA